MIYTIAKIAGGVTAGVALTIHLAMAAFWNVILSGERDPHPAVAQGTHDIAVVPGATAHGMLVAAAVHGPAVYHAVHWLLGGR